MAKRGRPRLIIDKRLFENLCAIQCTLEEICSVLDCDNKTVETWCKYEYGKNFSEIFSKKRKRGLVSLRRAQFQKAIDEKNTTMQIWLGKQWLGQTEKEHVKVDSKVGVTTLADLMIDNYANRNKKDR